MKTTHIMKLMTLLTIWSFTESTSQPNKQDAAQREYRILFVGNSLTYTNNLPKLVTRYAATKGLTIKTKSVAKGGYAIVDHWAEGRVQKLIRSQNYDYVVIQQGPSSQLEGYQMLVNGGANYAQISEENNTQLAYFMVWPSLRHYHTFDGVIRNYTASAQANNAILIPVGTHWKQHIEATNDRSYYGSDKFHPSRAGSKKAAEIIVETLFAEADCVCED